MKCQSVEFTSQQFPSQLLANYSTPLRVDSFRFDPLRSFVFASYPWHMNREQHEAFPTVEYVLERVGTFHAIAK